MNLNEQDLTDNKQFWRTVKPLLSDKITLVEQRETLDSEDNIDHEIVNDDVKIVEILKKLLLTT